MGVLSGGQWTNLPVTGFARGDECGNEFRQLGCYATDWRNLALAWMGESIGGNSHGCHAPSILAAWFVEPDNPPCYLACSDAGCVSPRGLRAAVSLAGLADARLGRPLAPDAQAYLSDRFLLAGCGAGEDALSLRPAVLARYRFSRVEHFERARRAFVVCWQ